MNRRTDESYGERVGRGAFFGRLLERAQGYVRNPKKLQALIEKATAKGQRAGRKGPFKVIWGSVLALFRLLWAYWKGEYRDVPTDSLILIIAGVLYFVMPLDLVPDFLVGAGFVDDAAVLAWILAELKAVLDDFFRVGSLARCGTSYRNTRVVLLTTSPCEP